MANLFLGLETSCDETAAAVFTDEPRVLANVIASQTDLHARFGGVVPEVAARAHLEAIEPALRRALTTSGVRLADLEIGARSVGDGEPGPALDRDDGRDGRPCPLAAEVALEVDPDLAAVREPAIERHADVPALTGRPRPRARHRGDARR